MLQTSSIPSERTQIERTSQPKSKVNQAEGACPRVKATITLDDLIINPNFLTPRRLLVRCITEIKPIIKFLTDYKHLSETIIALIIDYWCSGDIRETCLLQALFNAIPHLNDIKIKQFRYSEHVIEILKSVPNLERLSVVRLYEHRCLDWDDSQPGSFPHPRDNPYETQKIQELYQFIQKKNEFDSQGENSSPEVKKEPVTLNDLEKYAGWPKPECLQIQNCLDSTKVIECFTQHTHLSETIVALIIESWHYRNIKEDDLFDSLFNALPYLKDISIKQFRCSDHAKEVLQNVPNLERLRASPYHDPLYLKYYEVDSGSAPLYDPSIDRHEKENLKELIQFIKEKNALNNQSEASPSVD